MTLPRTSGRHAGVHGNGHDEGDNSRFLTLTDGVVAIAMTLLALDLKPDLPSGASSRDLAHYLAAHTGQYLAFLIAFVLIAQYWVVHHQIMRTVLRHDVGLTWVNMLFLLGITLLPLTTYIQGSYRTSLGTCLFALNLLLVAMAALLLSEVIERKGLRESPFDRDKSIRVRFREVAAVLVMLVVAIAAWVIPGQAEYLFLLLCASDVPGRIALRRPPSGPRSSD
jgi:uncharacterized membrane protein